MKKQFIPLMALCTVAHGNAAETEELQFTTTAVVINNKANDDYSTEKFRIILSSLLDEKQWQARMKDYAAMRECLKEHISPHAGPSLVFNEKAQLTLTDAAGNTLNDMKTGLDYAHGVLQLELSSETDTPTSFPLHLKGTVSFDLCKKGSDKWTREAAISTDNPDGVQIGAFTVTMEETEWDDVWENEVSVETGAILIHIHRTSDTPMGSIQEVIFTDKNGKQYSTEEDDENALEVHTISPEKYVFFILPNKHRKQPKEGTVKIKYYRKKSTHSYTVDQNITPGH